MKKQYILTGVITFFVLLSIIYGFTIIGFPPDSRGIKFDNTRRSNLRDIKTRIESYASSNGKLPQAITEATREVTYIKTNDPENGKPYEYYTTGVNSYKLCATFSTEYESSQSSNMALYDYSYSSSQFRHEKGYNCFPFTAQLGSQYNYPTPTIGPLFNSMSFADKNILSVTTATTYDQTSKFPEGFFSEDENEHGLIMYSTRGIYIYVNFIKPVKLSNISSTFSECPVSKCESSTGVRIWTVEGNTSDNQNISLIDNEKLSTSSRMLNVPVATDKEFTRISFRTTGPITWKKIKFSYK